MSNNKRVFKLSEFIAHGSNVTCVTIGRKSTRIAATGGEDKKVNLWTLNKPTCIMSLTGHTSNIQTMSFSPNEDKIVSGSTSGSLKVWDLEMNRIISNLTGHKASVACAEFHAYADYIASGSMDSHIRLWDLRRKGCIFTYKGHTGCVNSLKFSPDSKWIASASDDSTVKIWDLKAGRLLTELKGHTSSVNALEFHPNEFLLASGSSDRTVKFWDLEKMETVSTTTPGPSQTRTILFEPNGQCLFAAHYDYLQTHSWEPSKCFDSVFCSWKQIYDLAWSQNKLIGASFSQNTVGIYAVDLTQIAPIGTPPSGQQQQQPIYAQQSTARQLSSTTRKNFHHEQRLEQPSEQQDDSQQSQIDSEKDDVTSNICDIDEYNKIFRPKKEILRARSPAPSGPSNKSETPTSNRRIINKLPSQLSTEDKVYPGAIEQQPIQPVPQVRSSIQQLQQQQQQQQLIPEPKQSPVRHGQMPQPQIYIQQQPIPSKDIPRVENNIQPNKIAPVVHEPENDFMRDFIPRGGYEAKLDAIELVQGIDMGHDTFMKAFRNRFKVMQHLRSLWTNGNPKSALDEAVSIDDMSVMADVLNQINQTASIWTLDICTILLPSIRKLIDSKYEEHIQVGCDSCKIILKNFGKLIKANIAPTNYGVDLSREERQKKCASCYDNLQGIIQIMEKKSRSVSSKLANNFKEINLLIKTLE